jgi:hypothetical protein
MNLILNRGESMPNSNSIQTGLRCVLSSATAVLILAAFSHSATAAITVSIDDFFGPPGGQTISQDGIGTVSSLYVNGDPGLLGGSRFMSLAVTADAGSIAIGSSNGSVLDKLVYENGSGVFSILQLSYNANGVGLAQDWSALTAMTFKVDSADQNGTAIIELFQGINYNGPAFATHTTAIPPISTLDSNFVVPFAAFATVGGFSFSDIGSIRISIEGPEAYDMVMHSVFATNDVPEASTVVPLAGLAVAGFGTWFARRRAAAR